MKFMHKAIWQSDGNLVIRGNTRALLYRAIEDVRNELGSEGDAEVRRTLQALQDALGCYDGALPSATELLGDVARERTARNLLKG